MAINGLTMLLYEISTTISIMRKGMKKLREKRNVKGLENTSQPLV